MDRRTHLAIERLKRSKTENFARRDWFDLAITFSAMQLVLVVLFFVTHRAFSTGVLEVFGAPSEWYASDVHDSLYVGGIIVTNAFIRYAEPIAFLAFALGIVGVAWAGLQTGLEDLGKSAVGQRWFSHLRTKSLPSIERHVRFLLLDRIISRAMFPVLVASWGVLLVLVAVFAWALSVKAGRDSGNQLKSSFREPKSRIQVHSEAAWARNKCFVAVATSPRGHLLWDGAKLTLAPSDIPISVGCGMADSGHAK